MKTRIFTLIFILLFGISYSRPLSIKGLPDSSKVMCGDKVLLELDTIDYIVHLYNDTEDIFYFITPLNDSGSILIACSHTMTSFTTYDKKHDTLLINETRNNYKYQSGITLKKDTLYWLNIKIDGAIFSYRNVRKQSLEKMNKLIEQAVINFGVNKPNQNLKNKKVKRRKK